MKQATQLIGDLRLLKLAKHGRSGKLRHKMFYFAAFNINFFNNDPKLDEWIEPENGYCGTAGCLFGEAVAVFPKLLKFKGNSVVLKNGEPPRYCEEDIVPTFNVICHLFCLTQTEAFHLFVPDEQRVYDFGGVPLDKRATRKQVAANIVAFVRNRNNGKLPRVPKKKVKV